MADAALSESKDSITLEYPNADGATAVCPGSKHVGFGGFSSNTKPNNTGAVVTISESVPAGSDVDRWFAEGHNRSAANDAKLTSLAYCAEGSKPKVETETDTVPANTFEPQYEVAAACPVGKTLIGGGYSVAVNPQSGGQVLAMQLGRQGNNNAYEAAFVNERTKGVDVSVTAVCGRGNKPTKDEKDIRIDEGKKASATARCRGDRDVVFGGYVAQYDFSAAKAAFPIALTRPDKDEIKVTGVHNTAAPGFNDKAFLTAIAYCR